MPIPPLTLFRYLTGRMAFIVCALYVGFAALIFIADFMENLRFAGKYANGDFGFALRLTAMRTPGLGQILTPFVFLFGSLWLFASLNRRSELSVMRSAGLSIWRLIGPPALFAALCGVLIVLFVDPVVTRMTSFSEQMKNDIRGKKTSLVKVFGDGIWLRQRTGDVTVMINAASLAKKQSALKDVTVWLLDDRSVFLERIDAPRAVFRDHQLVLHNAVMKKPGDKLPQKTPLYSLSSSLTIEDFRDGTQTPETMSLWDLPHYTRIAEAAGLPTVRYQLRFHDLCATPLRLSAMVLIAALFCLKPVRSGGAFRLVLAAVAAGFLVYFVSEISTALGESNTAPVVLAAWGPVLAAVILAVTGLLHFEEG
ncbi:MAG: LPS export ABC transporter permease LptG [Pseudomonadota bacterium]